MSIIPSYITSSLRNLESIRNYLKTIKDKNCEILNVLKDIEINTSISSNVTYLQTPDQGLVMILTKVNNSTGEVIRTITDMSNNLITDPIQGCCGEALNNTFYDPLVND